MSVPTPDSEPRAARAAVRMFGRLQLLRLIGKSVRTMAWLAVEPGGAERMIVLPRAQPHDPAGLEQWMVAVRRAARLQHPHLAPVLELGVQDGWPFVLHDLRGRAPWSDGLARDGLPGAEAAPPALQVLRGLAYAHDAGVAHHDLQPWLVLIDESGQALLAGLGVGGPPEPVADRMREHETIDSRGLRAHRRAAERDVLAFGVMLHGVLVGSPALDEPDIGRVIARVPPLGRELVRLPWSGAHPIAEPLRAIVNRATDRQERHRYRNARTLINALEGWLDTEAAAGGGLLALLADRLHAAGALPSSPGAAARAARLALMERERTNELAEVVLEDAALAFELLRIVNTAQVRGVQVSGSGPVLTVRRAIAMLGLDGVRRAALALRPWPGPLDDVGASQLERLIERVKQAGRVALALRPPGYDGEVVYLVTLLHALGRLVVQYHFPDEARQIRRLMQPGPPLSDDEPEDPGMSEESAAYAVLGVDIATIGNAVARWWGLEDGVLAMIRRLPTATPVRTPETEDEMVRALASCGHEAVDALALPEPHVAAALQRVARRYARALDLTLRDLQKALQRDPDERISQPGLTAPAPLDALPTAPGRLRSAAGARTAG
jgi:eukaryotic-like serine/threonine-protein kinase